MRIVACPTSYRHLSVNWTSFPSVPTVSLWPMLMIPDVYFLAKDLNSHVYKIKKKRSRCEKSNMTFAETHTEIKLARERDRARCSCYTDTILLENSKKGFVTKDKS